MMVDGFTHEHTKDLGLQVLSAFEEFLQEFEEKEEERMDEENEMVHQNSGWDGWFKRLFSWFE